MDLSGDSSDLTILIVCLVSHDASLQKEVAFISEEVLPRLWLWCNSQKVKLVVNHCKLKEELVEEVVNGLKCHYVDSAKPRSYMSLIVNLISEFQVETIDALGDTGMEFGCKEPSTHSLFLLFRNICSSCFPGECINYESVFKCNVQSATCPISLYCTPLWGNELSPTLDLMHGTPSHQRYRPLSRPLLSASIPEIVVPGFALQLTTAANFILVFILSNEILHITRQCQYCEETSDVSQPTANFSFCKKFLDFFESYISLKLNSKSPAAVGGSDGWVDHLSSLQLSRINSTDAYLNPVKETVDKIDGIIKDDLTQVPLLLLGEPGTLKTSIIAAAILRIAEQELNSEPRQLSVFYHFAGLLPRSMELDVFLRRLVKQLNLVEDLGTSIDICLAVQLCNVALSNPSAAPIIIYVDSVDLLDDIVSGQKVKWIPSKLAPKVRLVLSTTTGSAQHLALKQRTNPPIEIFISALQIPSRMFLVSSSLSDIYPRTWAEVVSKIIGMDASSNPAWIGAVCCLLSLSAKTASVCCPDFEQLQRKIESTISQAIEKIWEDILSCLEQLLSRDQVVCILSLIAVAAAGLRRLELLGLLNSHPLVLPSPFEEKAEAEVLEKVISCSRSVTPQLTIDQLDKILLELKPCTLQLFDGIEDRFYIRSDVLKNAIRNKYFVYNDVTCLPNEDSDMLDLSCFWHQKLANYFQSLPDSNRKFEEYLFQVCHLEDSDGLAEYLTQWSVFDRLYTDEHSTILLSYWKKAGGTGEMISRYKSSLAKLEADRVDTDSLAVRHEQVARLFILTGRYAEALELAKRALKWEEKELGMRPERMVEVYGLLTDIYDEKLKLQDFISPSQIPDLRRTISYGRKSIDIRRQLTGRYHKFKLGVSLMKLAFSLESWAGCGGDDTFATTAALTEGQGHADKAIEIFKELNDQGHYAEALMTKGVLSLRGTPEQLRLYHEALDICQEVNGEYHILTSRIYINIGIVYEDNKDYVKAYKYFAKWARVNEVVLGQSHPKTMRAQRVLREPRYMYIASRLKDLERAPVDESDRGNVLNEDIINVKARQLDESTQERSDEGNSDGEEERDAEEPDVLDVMRPAHSTLFSLASELRRNIEEMLQHAMRESRDDDLRVLFADNRVTDRVTELESVLSSDSCMFDSDGDNNNDDNETDDTNGDNEVS